MKRGYSATTGPNEYGAQCEGTWVHGDENSAPNQQQSSKLAHSQNYIGSQGSTALIKPSLGVHVSTTNMPEKESIAKNTRAAIRRHALGDVSNVAVATAAQVNSRALRTRPASAKVSTDGEQAEDQARSSSLASSTKSVALVEPAIVQDWDDLDAEDADDPAMVAEYAEDIYQYLYSLELRVMPDPNYMANQPEICWKMRSVLIDWLVEVHWKLKLLPETLFLATNLVDRFLSVTPVSLPKFQLVGISATMIASKFEEILSPCISNYVYLSDNIYTEPAIIKAECFMLNALEFVISFPNPYVFLRRISKADNYDIHTRTLAKYLLEISLLDAVFIKYPPSKMAAASLFFARKMLNRGEWNANLRHYSNYQAADLVGVVQEFIEFFRRPMKQEAVFRKYSSKKFYKASLFVKEYINKYHGPSASPSL